ncbi:hypothetical protein, partial [Halohasta litchfieldiae]|uniref:hypothetical protein n=1 Tax=Halohasta litchfieldiae TaxID=1073996 RepID=UPI001C43133A
MIGPAGWDAGGQRVDTGGTVTDNIDIYNIETDEGVIESVTHEDAGCWNCVYERQHPARGDFYRR